MNCGREVGPMSWHVEAEMVAFVIVGIILIYSREGNMLPTLKNRVFQLCLFTTFLSIGLNIASVCLIAAGSAVPVILTDVVNTLYFVATPAMALTYFYYTVAYVYEHSARIRRVYLISTIPYAVYMALPWPTRRPTGCSSTMCKTVTSAARFRFCPM